MSSPTANRVAPPPSPPPRPPLTTSRTHPLLSPAIHHLTALEPLTENLSTAITCPICLEHMSDARQLQCGHLFCANCVLRILRMPKVRCALCKQKTTKRMVRAAPLPFQQIARGLHLLQRLIQQNKLKLQHFPPSTSILSSSSPTSLVPFNVAPSPATIMDGFPSSINDRLATARFRCDSQRFLQNRANHSGPDISPVNAAPSSKNERSSSFTITAVSATKANANKNEPLKYCPHANTQPTSKEAKSTCTESNVGSGPRKCMLCPSTKNAESDKENDVEDNNGSLQPTEFGRWLQLTKAEFERGNGNRWVHEKCALFSEDIYQVDGMVDNVHRVVARSSNRLCAGCHQKGATVRCWSHSNNCDNMRPVAADTRGRNNDSCNAMYHYQCAVKHGCVFVEDGYRMFCPQHKDDAPRIDDATFMQSLSEPADEASVRHDDYCYVCRTGGRLLMCDTCYRTTHPACSGLRRIPIGDWSCSVCTGSSPPHRPFSSGGVSLSSKRISGGGAAKSSGSRGKRARASDNDYPVFESDVGYLPGEGVDVCDGGTSTSKRSRRGSTASDVSVGTTNPSGACGMRRLVVAATGLNDAQKETFATLAKACRVTVKDDVEDRVTHVVIGALEAHDKPTRTMKLCRAVARRLPILCWPWVSTSIANGRPVDTTGYLHSVTRDETEAAVFYGRMFSFSTFSGDKQKRAELGELVKLGGGTIASSESQTFDGVVFVRNEDGVQQRRQSRGKSRFEPPDGATVVPYTWILDQITQRSRAHS